MSRVLEEGRILSIATALPPVLRFGPDGTFF